MSLITYITKIQGRYYYRQRIPLHLLSSIPNKKEIKFALGTSDYRLAKTRGTFVNSHVMNFFGNVANGMDVEVALSALDKIREEAKKWQALVAQVEGQEKLISSLRKLDKSPISIMGMSLPFGRLADDAEQRLEELASKETLSPTEEKEAFDIAAQFEQLRNEFAGQMNDFKQEVKRTALGNATSEMGNKLFSEMYAKYLKDKIDDISFAYRNEYRNALPFFINVVGDKPVAEYTRDDIRFYMDILLKMPAMKGKANKFFKHLKGKPLDIVKLNESRDIPFPYVAPRTVGSTKMSAIRTFFDYLIDESAIKNNPASGIQPKGVKGKKGKKSATSKDSQDRPPFTTEQLQAIFNADFFTGGVRDMSSGLHKPGFIQIRTSKFWVPLIGLFTGMRPAEIGQMLIGEVQEFNGRLHFKVQDDLSKKEAEEWKVTDKYIKSLYRSVKTNNGFRMLPVHPELIRIGFEDFINDRRRKHGPGKRIFEECWNLGAKPRWSDYFRWQPFLRAYGIYDMPSHGDGNVCLYSLRHNFKDAMRDAGIPLEVQNRFMGHEGEKGTGEIYGTGLLTPNQSNMIDLVNFEGLDLSHVTYKKKRLRKK